MPRAYSQRANKVLPDSPGLRRVPQENWNFPFIFLSDELITLIFTVTLTVGKREKCDLPKESTWDIFVPAFSALSKVQLPTTSMAVNPVQFLIVLNGYNLWTEKTAELYEISEMAKLHFDGSLGGYHFSKGMDTLNNTRILLPEIKFTNSKTKYN